MVLAPAGNLSVTTLESHDSQAPVDSKSTDSTCTLPFTATLTGRFAVEPFAKTIFTSLSPSSAVTTESVSEEPTSLSRFA